MTYTVSCTKDTDKFTPYTTSELNDVSWSNEPMAASKFIAITTALKSTAYTSSFMSSNGLNATFNNQVLLQMPSNNYSLNGVNYTNSVHLKLTQLTHKGDYIRNLMSSCKLDMLYDSKSAFLTELFDNSNNALSYLSNSSYKLSLVNSSVSSEYKFIVGSTGLSSVSEINWRVADSSENGYLQTSTILLNGEPKQVYEVTSHQLNWISIAKPIVTTNKVNFNVVLAANNFTNKNTVVFAVFKDYNTVIKLLADHTNKMFVAQNLPMGNGVTLVSISYIDGQFYLGQQNILVSTATQYTIKPSLQPISLSNLNIFLDGL